METNMRNDRSQLSDTENDLFALWVHMRGRVGVWKSIHVQVHTWDTSGSKPCNVFRDPDGLGIIGYTHGFEAEWLLASKAPLYVCSEKEGLGARGTRTEPWGAHWPALTCKFIDMPQRCTEKTPTSMPLCTFPCLIA